MSYTASYIVNSSSAQGTTDFQFTFPYIKEEHIEVFLNFSKITQGSGSAQYQVITNVSPKLIRLNTGIASANLRVEVRRNSSLGSPLVDYADGSTLTANDLDTSALQSLYIDQELKDNQGKTVSVDETTALPTLGNNRLTNVADPVGAQDAATKNYIDTFTGNIDGRDLSVDGAKLDGIETGATADQTNAEIRAAVEAASDSNVFTDADHSKLNAIEASATADQTDAEIRTAVENATDSNVFTDADHTKLNAIEASATADQTDAEIRAAVEAASDSNVFTDADHTKLNAIEASATADQTAAEIKTAYESNAQTNPLTDAEKAVIDGVTANTSELNKLDGVTASTTELNIVAGKTFKTSSGTLDTTSDTEIPSAKVIAAHVASSQTAIGGFVTIADEVSFPNTQPATGVVISINNAAGVVINGSGVSTTGRRLDSTTVTINGFPSSLNGETLAAGVGLVVTSTNTANTYAYHKLLAAETDVKQLSDDINDFNARYRVASSAPGSSNDAGDMYFDTSANKMKVYNGTTNAWDDVASVGSFYVNTISSSSGTGGGSATFNGSAYRFTLSNAGTSAQQHIVSVNGVIQKPNSGNSQPSEGFALSGNDIIFSAAPASGSDSFIITCGSSVSIGTPSANSVNSSHIIDGSIVDGDISNSANIAGSKVADDSIPEAKLDVHNAPATDKYLKYTSNGMEWSDGASEGTDVKSTGESGTTKFLRVDGDGTCSWQVPPDTNTQLTLNDEDNFASNSATAAASQQSIKAYVDTQVGSISAAPEITATADGAIAANKPVRINEDGTISEIKNTALSAATGSNTDIPHAYDPNVKAAVWISTTKFVLFWIATGSGNDRLQAAVGTASGTSITYGSKVEISTDNDVHRVSAVYDSSIDVILLTYCPNNSGNGGNGYIKGLTVSGTTITVNPTGQSNGDASHTVDIASDGKGGFIQQWVNKDGQWYALAGTVTTAGAISKGSGVHIANSRSTQTAYNTMRICYDSDKDAFVSICRFNNNIDFAIFTRSGTIATKTSASTPPTIISGTQNSNVNIVYVKSELRFFIVGRSSSSPYSLKYATPKMNTAGTALDTGGSGTLFAGKQDYMGFTAYDEGVNKIFHTFADDTSGQQDTKLLTITLNSSGTTTGTGSVTSEQLASHKEEHGQALACNGAGLVLTGVDKSDDSDVLSRLKQLATTVSNLKADSFIGFSSAAISDSSSGTVNVVGNTATLSSLTPSKKYYVQKGGTVSTATDDPSVVAGIAVSSTKLLIKG